MSAPHHYCVYDEWTAFLDRHRPRPWRVRVIDPKGNNYASGKFMTKLEAETFMREHRRHADLGVVWYEEPWQWN